MLYSNLNQMITKLNAYYRDKSYEEMEWGTDKQT